MPRRLMGNGDTAPSFLTSTLDGGCGQSHVPDALLPRKYLPVPTEYEVEFGWVLGQLRAVWSTKEFRVYTGNRTPAFQP
jgi:hypothetical protein